jgi:uncharacterized membrane protein YhaH (DUF805 family)
MDANTSRNEFWMWIVFLSIWAVFVWSFNTGYVVQLVSPTGTTPPSTMLGIPVNILYVVLITAILIVIPTIFLYRMDLRNLPEPETDRVWDRGD